MKETLVQKLFRTKNGGKHVTPGELLTVSIDKVMIHDLFISSVWEKFKEMGFKKVWHPDQVVIIFDHLVPTTRIEDPIHHGQAEAFIRQQGIKRVHRHEGICHQLMIEKHHVKPGDIVVGTDSHTTTYGAVSAFSTGIGYTEMAAVLGTGKLWLKVPETIRIELNGCLPQGVSGKDVILKIIGDLGCDGANYKALEFGGSMLPHLSMSERMTISNMAVECGAKIGIFEADEITARYYGMPLSTANALVPDPGVSYCKKLVYEGKDFKPMIACPHSVENIEPVQNLVGKPIDEVFIGSCTNGRYEDLEVVARVWEGKHIAPHIRCIITPASQKIYEAAIESGILKILLSAGAMVTTPGCGLCCGRAGGIVCEGEVVLATNNRNFMGRMGSASAQIYLASPRIAALSALQGRIAIS